jgi:hypothetical protein
MSSQLHASAVLSPENEQKFREASLIINVTTYIWALRGPLSEGTVKDDRHRNVSRNKARTGDKC